MDPASFTEFQVDKWYLRSFETHLRLRNSLRETKNWNFCTSPTRLRYIVKIILFNLVLVDVQTNIANSTKRKKRRQLEKKVTFWISFLRYSFLQGSCVNIFLTHNEFSFLEALCLANTEASTKSCKHLVKGVLQR